MDSRPIAASLARYAEGDVKGQLSFYDHDNDGVIEYDWGALTGNDADAVSFHWRAGNLDRAEGAYQYSGALAAAQAYDAIGNASKAAEMRTLATRIKDGIVGQLWNPSRNLLEHRHVATNAHVPWKEINNYYPYAVGLMPNTDQYRQALRLYADPAEYPIFPFFTANQKDKAAAAAAGQPGSNNFSTINSTVQFRLFSSVLRNYPNQWITAEDYKKLLYWNAWAQFVNGDTQWPDANEFWANWNPNTKRIDYRSWIHHNILGSSNWTIDRGRGRTAAPQRQQGRALADQHRLAELHGQQPAVPQHRPDDRVGRPERRRRRSTPASPRATRSTSTAAARSR